MRDFTIKDLEQSFIRDNTRPLTEFILPVNKPLKERIIQNQKIVDELLTFLHFCTMMEKSPQEFLNNTTKEEHNSSINYIKEAKHARAVVGGIIERVTGKTIDEIMQDNWNDVDAKDSECKNYE